jgi:transcriptional regulator with XRE-family HTH domain
MPESRISRADRRTASFLVRIGEEIRTARNMAGLTLAEGSRAAGMSRSEASRIERGESSRLPLATLARITAVVGLDLWIRAYPGAEPVRDRGHVMLGDALQALAGTPLVVRTEVRIGDRRDLRAWDLTITEPGGRRCGVELETRFVDAQAQHRRISQKLADSALDMVLVVLADTRANRAAVRAATGYLSSDYVIEDPTALEALRAGRLPPRSALIFVPIKPHRRIDSRPTGADDSQQRRPTKVSRGMGRRAPGSRPTGRQRLTGGRRRLLPPHGNRPPGRAAAAVADPVPRARQLGDDLAGEGWRPRPTSNERAGNRPARVGVL